MGELGRLVASLTRVLIALSLAVLVVTSTASARPPGASRQDRCRPLELGSDHAGRVKRALRAGEDVWGNALLQTKNGPTYKGARRYLSPVLFARGPRGSRLTASGVYYLAFTHPVGAAGPGHAALHVADGSQILSRRIGGRSLTIGVGRGGRERYGACLTRLTPPRLAQGYLPILQTGYVDDQGVRYRQESFSARASEAAPLTSFLRITADAADARGDGEIRLAPGGAGIAVPEGAAQSVFVAWSHDPTHEATLTIDPATYETARTSVVRYWQERLSEGATIDVPEPQVRNALGNLAVQELGLGWRYSVGNPYEQFSYPEALDVAQVVAAYGFRDVAAAILRRSLSTPRAPYPNWRLGQKLVATAAHYRLFGDRELLDTMTPELRRGMRSLARQLHTRGRGLLQGERYSSDIPDLVYGLHSQAVVWRGLVDMSSVWRGVGDNVLAARCRRIATSLEHGLRRAVRRSQRRLADGSLFVPVRLLDRERPYGSVTETRAGSYWNLVMPYALASGLFAPHSREAEGILRYQLRHGSRLLGLVRAGAYSLYGRNAPLPVSGVNPVYGLNVARFLADNDRPDQLVLSLYGQLAAGMSPGTFVSGEAASIAPLRGEYYRSMYLPPNGASNASFLETLRLMLVHETRDRNGRPNGLELAYATPRAWLEPGKRIAVHNLPTSFGPISFSIDSRESTIQVSVAVPARSRPQSLSLRVRLPTGDRIARITEDGHPLRSRDRNAETVELPVRPDRVDLVVGVERR